MPIPLIKNRVGCSVSGTPGTGTITLSTADTGHRTFATAYGANANVDILVEEGSAWEIARDCTFDFAANTVTRGTFESSSTGSTISFTSAAKVYVVHTSERIQGSLSRGVVRVTANGTTSQTISPTTFTKLSAALATEVVDQNGWWDHTNKRFLPTRPGQYLVVAGAGIVGLDDTKSLITAVYKNGVIHTMVARGYSSSGGSIVVLTGAAIVELNGSTDYVELYVYHTNTASLNMSIEAERVSFSACWIGG